MRECLGAANLTLFCEYFLLALPLVDLDLTGFLFVTDEAILTLEAAQHLQILSLSGTKLTDIGAAVFVHLSSLKVLSLERTSITDKAIEYMRGNAGYSRIVI